MNKKIILFAALSATSAFAGTMGVDVCEWNYVTALSLGAAWPMNTEQNTFFLTPAIQNTYTAGVSKNAVFDGELFLGFQKPLTDMFALNNAMWGQLGLAVAATTPATFDGQIWQDADPIFDNYVYRYKIQHTHLAAKGKLQFDVGYLVQPWVNASLGVAWNNAYNFITTPVIFPAVAVPNFTRRTTTAFTWTAGAGLQYACNPNWQVGIGYEFADWGRSQFGRAAEQTLNNGLALNNIYTNAVLANLTYLS